LHLLVKSKNSADKIIFSLYKYVIRDYIFGNLYTPVANLSIKAGE